MKFLENRRKRKEIERNVRFRQGKARIKQILAKNEATKRRFWKLGQDALELGNQKQFRQIAQAYLWTLQQIKQWKNFLLMMETFEARRDQMAATGEYLKSMSALSASIMTGADPAQLAQMQQDMEMALGRAATMEESLAAVMDTSADMIFPASDQEDEDEEIANLEKMMLGEVKHSEHAKVDARIEEGIAKLAEDIRKGDDERL